MTTTPAKPSERIRQIREETAGAANFYNASATEATLAALLDYLDEQHAAGRGELQYIERPGGRLTSVAPSPEPAPGSRGDGPKPGEYVTHWENCELPDGHAGDCKTIVEPPAAVSKAETTGEPDKVQEALASRYAAGESIRELAADYEMREDLVLRAIRRTLGYLLNNSSEAYDARDEAQARYERSQAQTDDYERALEAEKRHTLRLTEELRLMYEAFRPQNVVNPREARQHIEGLREGGYQEAAASLARELFDANALLEQERAHSAALRAQIQSLKAGKTEAWASSRLEQTGRIEAQVALTAANARAEALEARLHQHEGKYDTDGLLRDEPASLSEPEPWPTTQDLLDAAPVAYTNQPSDKRTTTEPANPATPVPPGTTPEVERPIVVGSTWRGSDSPYIERHVKHVMNTCVITAANGAEITWDTWLFRKGNAWVSDPPLAPTEGQS